ncbi:hypothetical protein BUALT_Bualt14G0052000 [Buddleja alternifolia]|uniref:SWIM-type domain-containing protein n=1 Tax=Buddleja alternifolia TaxID=168488 RepID=A0AAV6WS16_9LAMI|nr:hypothetical protein BUALT_Bualt14G0052000 [Buddleja alternifolia]
MNLMLKIPEFDDDEPVITMIIHHGGQIRNRTPEYIGGTISKFDFVELKYVNVPYVDKLCELLGYMGVKRYFRFEDNDCGFVLLVDGHQILDLCLSHEFDREVHLYLDSTKDLFNSQVGSSNMHFSEPTEADSEEFGSKEGFTDSDFDIGSDEEDERVDNELFIKNVDEGIEWAGGGSEIGNEGETDEDGNDYIDEGEIVSNSSDFDSSRDSEDENEPKYPVYCQIDMYDPRFELTSCFSTKKEFLAAVRSHAIKTQRNIKITSNDKRRVYAKCVEEGCEWRIHALRMVKDQPTFQIKDYKPVHKCGTNYHVKNCSSPWIGRKYQDLFVFDPRRSIKGFRQDVIEDIKVHVSKNQAYRAKWSALKKIEGSSLEQYGCLWDYAEELRRSNPGSIVILSAFPDTGNDSVVFDKLYCCFKGLKDGFLAGCRPIISVDGCHLKGLHGGVLLAAIGIDSNNSMYPICYVVVARETKATWEWFLNLLKHDLNIVANFEYTFMSDKQKGLLPAFEKVFPNSINRYCVRHLHGNTKVAGFRGQAHKKALWKAAMASTVNDFDVKFKEMCKMDLKLGQWLIDKSPSEWSRSHFTIHPKCDILLNNYCESFNAKIRDAREKHIYTMLEMIRIYLMSRLQQNRDRATRRWSHHKICPKIRIIIQKNMEKAASDCISIKSNEFHYEIEGYDKTKCTVDLQKRSCSCRKWDLSGIPCKHGMNAIMSQRLNGEDFVDECYSVRTYQKIYVPCIYPVNGAEKWHKQISMHHFP